MPFFKMDFLILLFSLVAFVSALPLIDSDGLEYHSIKARQQNLPLLKLPYGTWQASKYDAQSDVYTFKNIRYAQAPVGPLRWAKPAPPLTNTTLQTGDVGGTCYQSLPPAMLLSTLTGGLSSLGAPQGKGASSAAADMMSSIMPYVGSVLENYPALGEALAAQVATQDLGKAMGGGSTNEDCLFLDLFVPGKALKGTAKLPVVNWIYGGAFIVGSKDGMYDGTPVVKRSDGNVIYVVANYRLGAFGFLGGTTVERDATPNAGFHDQRAVFEWIQKYIELVNGNPKDVTVWGESAGAGSIMHQLVAYGGKQPALFQKAMIQSPANNPQFDRKGQLEQQFQRFATLAGCAGEGIACLRSKDVAIIRKAADTIIASAPPGQYGFGPVVDGTLIRQLPDLELASGNHQKDIQSIIVTHVSDEASAFVANSLKNNKTFFEAQLLSTYGPNLKVKEAILKKYPTPGPESKFADEKARFTQYMQHQFFTCHVRTITNAYASNSWVGMYSRGTGKHGMDMKADFYNSDNAPPKDDPGFAQFAPAYQNYLLSHARTGDPNTLQQANGTGAVVWPKVKVGATYGNVLEAGKAGFTIIDDKQTSAEECDIWTDVLAGVTKSGGYTPPGGEVPTTFA